ncbi:MAG: prepilin peptidase [Kiritimatiellia bacterium]
MSGEIVLVNAVDAMSAGLPPLTWAVYAAISALLGACIGSFLNVCIYRIPLDQSVVRPRSHCMKCGKLIPWYHNIPVVSYFVLRGKCSSCGEPFSFRYAAIELLTAFLFLAVFCLCPPSGSSPPFGFFPLYNPETPPLEAFRLMGLIPVYWLFVSGLIIGTFIDFDHFILPDSVTIGGMVAGLILSTILPELQMSFLPGITADGTLSINAVRCHSALAGLKASAIGLAAGFVPLQTIRLLATWIFRKRGRIAPDEYAMGFGDIKLVGAIGAFLGWQAAIFSIFAAAALGTLVSIPMLLAKKRQLLDRIPFGPYLSAAALVWLFWSDPICASYLRLFF